MGEKSSPIEPAEESRNGLGVCQQRARGEPPRCGFNLHEPWKKVFFYLVTFYAHIFKYVIIRSHHVWGTGYIKRSLYIVRNRSQNHVFIYSAYQTRPISRNSLPIGQSIEHLDTKFRLRFA